MTPERRLSLFDITCLGINAIVGSGIFLFPGRLAGFLGPASILSFGLTALLLSTVGLCYAQAATYFDRAGASYLYVDAAFGEWTGFGVGWVTWATQLFSWAAVADAIALYLNYFSPFWNNPWAIKAVAGGVILLMGALNYRGVKLGAIVSNFFTGAKIIPLLVLLAFCLPHLKTANYIPFAPHGWRPMGRACFLAYFAFQGFEYAAVPSGEVKNPSRVVPLALILAMGFSSILYMLIQFAAVGVYPQLASSQSPLASAAFQVLGPFGAALMVIGTVISTTGYTASAALVAPRCLEALCEDRHLPMGLARLHPKFQTPYRAVLLTTALAFFAAVVLDFDKLVDFTNIVVCVQYAAVCASIPILMRKLKAPEGSFRLPGRWLIPVLGFFSILWLGAQGGIKEVEGAVVVLFIGFAAKIVWAYFRKEQSA